MVTNIKNKRKHKNNNSNVTKNLTRKEIRKQKRECKKQTKRLFFSKKLNIQNDVKEKLKTKCCDEMAIKGIKDTNNRRTATEIPESNFSENDSPKNITTVTKKKEKLKSDHPSIEEIHKRDIKQEKSLKKHAQKRRVRQLKLENEEEDKFIAKLEKKLKLNKAKNKDRSMHKMFSTDGLDFALELCLDDNNQTDKVKDNNKEVFVEDESENSTEESDGDSENISNESNENEVKEDIYGRMRDKDGNVLQESNAYLPPHRRLEKRVIDNKEPEICELLLRRTKGLLNRLSENNLHKISTAIEELYAKNSRHNMNDTLYKLLQESLISHVMTNERMVQEHTVLLAYIHAQIGSEIGAFFLQMFIEQFNTLLNDHQHRYHQQLSDYSCNEDKRLNNLVLILCYMFMFKLFDHNLLLEIVDRLSQQLTEKTIECLLLLFQTVGFKLRKDEPLSFKGLLLNVQTKIAAATSSLNLEENKRVQFMVEILHAIKNNNTNKVPRFDAMVQENLRKKLKSMLKNDKYVVTLNIGMEDLLKADSAGKWWIIGSAWSGNKGADLENKAKDQSSDSNSNGNGHFSNKLLHLAKQHKMNTEERRKIFCIVMSADDFVDAFEKILQLALKDQRSIAYVILYCCLNEKSPNPYYSHLALKFCNHNRKYQLAFQFASWDRINDIKALNKTQLNNFSVFLYDLILQGALQLSVLKVIDFLQLDKRNYILMRKICTRLLLTNDEERLQQAFERLAKNNQIKQFKQSIRLFFQYTLLKDKDNNQSISKLNSDQQDTMKRRIEYIDKLLAYVDL